MAETPAHLFKPGRSGNPAGRPKGTRNKLAGDFFHDLHGVWEEQGEAVLRRAAFEKPMEFAAMVAKLMPAKLEITTPTSGLSDERFQELMDLAERQLALSAEGVGLPTASMTIEGASVLIGEGEGSPQGAASSGGIIEVVHYSAQIPDTLLSISPSERGGDLAADTQATPFSIIAKTPTGITTDETLEPGIETPITPVALADPLEDDEVDVDALFR